MPAKTMTVCGLMLLAATLTLKARGPIENPGMKVAVDEQGVQTRGYTFRNECQKSSPWRAKWIWINGRLVSRGPVDMGKDFAGGDTRRRRHAQAAAPMPTPRPTARPRNGDGGPDTADDGKTFRGYGQGDWLAFSGLHRHPSLHSNLGSLQVIP